MPILKRQRFRLVDILKNNYVKRDDIESICGLVPGIKLTDITIEGSASKMWTNIIEHIENDDEFEELMDILSEDFQKQDPGNELKRHQRFVELLQEMRLQTSEALLNMLAEKIPAGECVLFLGPKAFQVKYQKQIMSFSEYLASRLVQELDKLDVFIDDKAKSNLSYLIDRYESREAAIPGEAKAFANKCFTEIKDKVERDLYENLENLNFPLVVNTNPDIVFGKDLPADKFERLRYDQSNHEAAKKLSPAGEDKRLIYNIFGSFENEQSVIWTEKEAVNFTKGAYEKNPPINPRVKLMIKQRYGLFIGFDFRDWSLKILFDILELKNKPGNYSVSDEVIDDQYLEYYSRQYNMTFITEELDFLKKLNDGN